MTRTTVVRWALLGLFLVSMGLAACNTVRGMGEDVESAGEGIQHGSKEVQKKL